MTVKPESVDLDQVRKRLLSDRTETTRLRDGLAHDVANVMAASRDVATDDEHDPEGATIAYERERTSALVDRADAHLDDIRIALARLDEGTYARCERCGREISAERLEARPVARRCLSCASAG